MRKNLLFQALLCLFVSFSYSQYATQGYDWDIYGDRYPTTLEKVYNEIPQFFIFEGPGNTNPGNGLDLAQTDPNLSIPSELKTYLAQQFKYILFDQESFCDRSSAWGAVTSTITAKYHYEAQVLMNSNSSLIVFPYFSFTIIRQAFPWYSSVPESWFLHQQGYSDAMHRISTPESGFYLMDISNASYRNFYINWIQNIVTTYGYRGIFLDNMTMYPWITTATQEQLPSGMFNSWYTHLTTFLTDLKNTVGTTPIVCNSLGIDDAGADPSLLYGVSNGANVVAQVSGGALMEGFHGTAWKWALDATLSMMNWMKTNNKIFLAATHYTRSGDALLSQRFNLAPLGTSGWIDDATRPPLATLYRMQMSYLARFLLVSSGTQKFGYSFQPGVLQYQFIPYYKPWDEKIGTPVDANYVDMGTYYKREFTHSISYINKSEANSLTITLPAGLELYWYDYYSTPPSANNVADSKVSAASVTLNKMEGIVLFKRVTVDQKLEDGTTSIDSVGHWINSKFIMYKAPKGIPLVTGSEVLKATQKVVSSQKYLNWRNLTSINNYQGIDITPQTTNLTSDLKSIQNATIQTTVDGFTVSSPTSIEFKDPWLIDYNELPYGNRNRGISAIFRSIGTPYTANNPIYNGVFLNQFYDPGNPQYPYFSLRAKLNSSDFSGFTGYFQNWSYNTSQIDMPPLSGENGWTTNAIVFKQSNAIATANYKGLNVSSNAEAYRNNSQRKIIKNNFGKVLTVYESQGNIWIEASSNNGATWSFEYFDIQNKPAPINTRAAKSPSLTMSTGVTILTYQELNADPNYTDI